MEAQETTTPASVTNLTEHRLRELINFDENLVDVVQRGLWMHGIPPLSRIGREVAEKIDLNKFWGIVYSHMKADATEEEIAHYITVITKVQNVVQNAFGEFAKEIENIILTASGKEE